MIVLDTNVVSELMQPEPDVRVASWFAVLGSEVVSTSVITVSEIGFGLSRLPDGAHRRRLEYGFEALVGTQGPLPVLELLKGHARMCGALRARREASGSPISLADGLTAAIVLYNEASLATRNTKDFVGLGLRLTDPWA
jgi:toxin FitB